MNPSEPIYLCGLASSFPDNKIESSFFNSAIVEPVQESKRRPNYNKMFLGPKYRRHVSRDQSAVDLFEGAVQKLAEENSEFCIEQVDAILTNVSLPDVPFTGCGAYLARRLNIRPKAVLDLHNGGCISFLLLCEYAKALMHQKKLKNALIAIAQTSAGRIFAAEKIRIKPQSSIPGDGACVAWISTEAKDQVALIEPVLVQCHPEFAEDMNMKFDDDRKYWEATNEPGYLEFPDDKVAAILMRGNRLVPEVMHAVLKQASLNPSQIGGLVTNQPNEYFLRNWRESIEVSEDRHFNTFQEYGNLFQAGIPVSLDKALRDGKIKIGQKIILAGFSHAGDYSAAGILNF